MGLPGARRDGVERGAEQPEHRAGQRADEEGQRAGACRVPTLVVTTRAGGKQLCYRPGLCQCRFRIGKYRPAYRAQIARFYPANLKPAKAVLVPSIPGRQHNCFPSAVGLPTNLISLENPLNVVSPRLPRGSQSLSLSLLAGSWQVRLSQLALDIPEDPPASQADTFDLYS
jgi:hypothetical protein